MTASTPTMSAPMIPSIRMPAAAIAWVALGIASSARAQASVEIAATVGVYAPYGTPINGSTCGTWPCRSGGGVTSMYGVQLRTWLSPTVGLQIDAGTSTPYEYGPFFNPGGSTEMLSSKVRAVTAQALITLAGEPGRGHLWLSAGAGAIQHYGSAYASVGEPTTFTGTIGLGGALRISHGLNLQAGASTLIYGLNVDDSGSLGYSTQYDLLFTAGLSWHFE